MVTTKKAKPPILGTFSRCEDLEEGSLMKLLTLAIALTLGKITIEVKNEAKNKRVVSSKKLEFINCKMLFNFYTNLIFFRILFNI